jgi:hypothetical protein
MYPHPDKPEKLVQPKAEKLVRRGPRRYFLLGKTPDGRPVEIRLVAGAFLMEGL